MNDSFDLYKRNTLRTLVKRRLKEIELMEVTQRRTVEEEMMKLNHLRGEIDNLMRILKEMDDESDKDSSSNNVSKVNQAALSDNNNIETSSSINLKLKALIERNKHIALGNNIVHGRSVDMDSYRTDAGWLTKAEFVLKRAERGLTLGQILDAIYEIDIKLKQEAEEEGGRRRHTTVLSPQLKYAVGKGTLVRHQHAPIDNNMDYNNIKADYVYYLSEWMDADKDIKPEYKRRN